MATYTYQDAYSAAIYGGFPKSVAPVAAAIAIAESGGKTDVVSKPNTNGTVDYGLWQINSSHTALLASGKWSDPNDNAVMAYTLYKNAGNKFTPWTTFNDGAYKKTLKDNILPDSLTGGPFDDIPNPLEPLKKAGDGIKSMADAVGNLVTHLLDPSFWKRVAFGFGGVMLIIIALLLIVESNPEARKATAEAAGAAVMA